MPDSQGPDPNKFRHLIDALDEALSQGISKEDLMALLTERITSTSPAPPEGEREVDVQDSDTGPGVVELRAGVPIYLRAPEGLITVPDAALKYALPQNTIQTWLFRGHIQQQGKVRGRARGGGFTLIDEKELLEFLEAPRDKGGRPSKQRCVPC